MPRAKDPLRMSKTFHATGEQSMRASTTPIWEVGLRHCSAPDLCVIFGWELVHLVNGIAIALRNAVDSHSDPDTAQRLTLEFYDWVFRLLDKPPLIMFAQLVAWSPSAAQYAIGQRFLVE